MRVIPERFQGHMFSVAQRAAPERRSPSPGRFGGLPNKRTLLFDPATGNLLACEEQLARDTGTLGVRPYSVIGRSTFRTA
ncbi:hypothetical protein ACWEIK_29830 [Streptomyces sp. NPDC004673]